MNIWRKILLAVVLVTMAATPLAVGDYAYTPVIFTVPSNLAFTVTLIGLGPTSSATSGPGTATSTLYFNTTTGSTQAQVQPCSGTAGAAPCQTTTGNASLNFTNTGTAVFNMTMRLNVSPDATIALYFNSSCGTSNCTAAVGPTPLPVNTTVWALACNGLKFISPNYCQVWLFANFTNTPAGAYTSSLLENSTLSPGNT